MLKQAKKNSTPLLLSALPADQLAAMGFYLDEDSELAHPAIAAAKSKARTAVSTLFTTALPYFNQIDPTGRLSFAINIAMMVDPEFAVKAIQAHPRVKEAQLTAEKIKPYTPFLLGAVKWVAKQAPQVRATLLKGVDDKMTQNEFSFLIAANAQKYAASMLENARTNLIADSRASATALLEKTLQQAAAINPQAPQVYHLEQALTLVKGEIPFMRELKPVLSSSVLGFTAMYPLVSLLKIAVNHLLLPSIEKVMNETRKDGRSVVEKLLTTIAKGGDLNAVFSAMNVGFRMRLFVFVAKPVVYLIRRLFEIFAPHQASIELHNTVKKSATTLSLTIAGHLEDSLRLPPTAITSKIADHAIADKDERQREMQFHNQVRATAFMEHVEETLDSRNAAVKLTELLTKSQNPWATNKANEKEVGALVNKLSPREFDENEKEILKNTISGSKKSLSETEKIALAKLSMFSSFKAGSQIGTVKHYAALMAGTYTSPTPRP